jgi:hypothetical protein
VWYLLLAGVGLGIVAVALSILALGGEYAECGSMAFRISLKIVQALGLLAMLLSAFGLFVLLLPPV